MGLFDFEKKMYFVDSENVSGEWTAIVSDAKKHDEIYIFYSDNSKRTSYAQDALIAQLEKAGVVITRVECGTGNNALDFQLSSHLGYCICKNEKNADAKFIIVSNDKGYDPLIPYWFKEKSADVIRKGVETEGDRRAQKKASANKAPVKKASTKKATSKKEVALKKEVTSKKESAPKKEIKPNKETTSRKDVSKKETGKKTVRWMPPKNDTDYIVAIGRSVRVSKKENYHVVLVQLFGQETGAALFNVYKSDQALQKKASEAYIDDLTKRQENIIRLILFKNQKKTEDLKKILTIIRRSKEDDLSGFYKELTQTFGEEVGREYHNFFKGCLRVIKRL